MNLTLALIFTFCGLGFACWYARLRKLRKISHECARFFIIVNVVMALSMVTVLDFASEGTESLVITVSFGFAVIILVMNIFNLATGKKPL